MKINKLFNTSLFLLVFSLVISVSGATGYEVQELAKATADTACRFGITSPLGSEGYDIASLGGGSYLDWGAVTDPELPAGVEYIRVISLRDDVYAEMLANLPVWVDEHPRSVWVIGNEPDTYYGGQDALLPEVYADRFYDLARIIRHHDRTALIAFGSIVQPTPIRIRYLTRAWDELVQRSGSDIAASRLIDIWSIHSFILNEKFGEWGTGVPPGFEYDHDDAIIITDFSDTYSIDIFQARVEAFRIWMSGIGQRDKPLWITEYGSLFPPIDPPGGPDYQNVSDELTAEYMLDTFDYMLNTANNQTGMPSDGYQLVQRWYWYSLNDYRYHFGGTLFDPDNFKLPTFIGESFIHYQADNLAPTDLFPYSLVAYAMSHDPNRPLVNYLLDIRIDNRMYTDATCAQVWVYDGNPDAGGVLIGGPIAASALRSDGGLGRLSVTWKGVEPLTWHTLYVRVESIGVEDLVPQNNSRAFTVYLSFPEERFLPLVTK